MGIQIVRFERKDGLRSWGRLEGAIIRAIPGPADSLQNFLLNRLWKQQPIKQEIELSEVRLLSPVTAPCQIICQGKNYLDHVIETGVNPAHHDHNILFTKADSTLAAPEGEIVRPEGVRLLDYEIELGIVIGAPLTSAQAVTNANLKDFVAGLVMGNDISARDVQVPQRQWFKGKSYRGFCPVGPILYLMEELDFPKLEFLELQLSVNGEVRQKATTSQLMHKPAETLAEISRIFDLRPGDLLLTGTPGGVAMKVKPKSKEDEAAEVGKSDKEKFAEFVEEQLKSPRYLKNGDKIESFIRSKDGAINLGVQRLTVRG